jgi:predicted nucleic acid-binding protein
LIVLDASAAVKLMTRHPDLGAVLDIVLGNDGGNIHVPGHFVAEVLSALRGLYIKGAFNRSGFLELANELDRFDFVTHFSDPLIVRIAQLSDNATPYDAAYLALAEALDCPLVTSDKKLADIPGSRAKVLLV